MPRNTQLPPSPPPLPLLGNLLDVAVAGTPWNLMLKLEPKFGPVTRLQLPIAGDFYLVHDPKVRPAPKWPSAEGCVYERRQERHTCAYSLSAVLRAMIPQGLTNDSEVSSHGNRRISAMCGWWCWAS